MGRPKNRRESSAVAKCSAPPSSAFADSIIVPAAQDRMLELIEREQLPADVNAALSGALSGDTIRQQLLFQAMIDTWPRLQKAMRVADAVRPAFRDPIPLGHLPERQCGEQGGGG